MGLHPAQGFGIVLQNPHHLVLRIAPTRGGIVELFIGHLGIGGYDLFDDYEKALTRAHARPMDFTGRPLKGMVYVAPKGVRTAKQLGSWVEQAVGFARSLPAK